MMNDETFFFIHHLSFIIHHSYEATALSTGGCGIGLRPPRE